MKKYTPVIWIDESPNQAGTVINRERLDRIQEQYLKAAGIQTLSVLPSVPDAGENICIVDHVLHVHCGAQPAWKKVAFKDEVQSMIDDAITGAIGGSY